MGRRVGWDGRASSPLGPQLAPYLCPPRAASAAAAAAAATPCPSPSRSEAKARNGTPTASALTRGCIAAARRSSGRRTKWNGKGSRGDPPCKDNTDTTGSTAVRHHTHSAIAPEWSPAEAFAVWGSGASEPGAV